MSESEQSVQEFVIQRVYMKDMSFEAPNTPNLFQAQWEPEMALDINTESANLEQDVYEVVLGITVTVKNKEQVAFLVELKQAGIFTIKGTEGEQLDHILGSFCPSILFPYAREAVSDLVSKGSFPQLVLAPVNFDSLYMQHLEEKASATQQ